MIVSTGTAHPSCAASAAGLCLPPRAVLATMGCDCDCRLCQACCPQAELLGSSGHMPLCAESVRACTMLSKTQMCINLHVKLHMNFGENLARSSTETLPSI